MDKIFKIFLLIGLAYNFNLFAQEPNSSYYNNLIQQANQLYINKNYEKALEKYTEIESSDYSSKELFYNIGNTHYKLNHLADAIYYYQKAKKIAPSDVDINFNLNIANQKVEDKINELPSFFITKYWQNILKLYYSDTWASICIGALFTLLLLTILFLKTTQAVIKKVSFSGIMGILILSLFSFYAAATNYHDEITLDNAIIFSPSVTVKNEPNIQSTDLFVIHQGSKVHLLEMSENWAKIELTDGNIGWLTVDSFKMY